MATLSGISLAVPRHRVSIVRGGLHMAAGTIRHGPPRIVLSVWQATLESQLGW
jgi:hypothetical protein